MNKKFNDHKPIAYIGYRSGVGGERVLFRTLRSRREMDLRSTRVARIEDSGTAMFRGYEPGSENVDDYDLTIYAVDNIDNRNNHVDRGRHDLVHSEIGRN